MAAGQAPLAGTLDVAALQAAEDLLETVIAERAVTFGRHLRAVLQLHATCSAAGMAIATTARVALVQQVSEASAAFLLEQATLLASLEGGLDAVDGGLLSVELAAVLTRQLSGLDPVVQAAVWAHLLDRLRDDREEGAVLPPARFAELLRRAVIRADPDDAVTRRRKAEAAGDVEYRRRDDGLVDLSGLGISGPSARAILGRIRERAQAFGSEDERSAGKRRLDAFVDLLLGRDQLPYDDGHDPLERDPFTAEPVVEHCGPRCGCRLGEPVPCGASVTVLVPLGAALGTTDELAELEGPLEPDLLQALLHNAPVLRPVYVDENGTPVAEGDAVERPPACDPSAVRDALLRMAGTSPPDDVVPRHLDDHRTNGGTAPPPVLSRPSVSESALRGPSVLTDAHPPDAPGGYRVPRRLARLLRVRAPRCEWPGCGIASARCDLDHDRAWPHGPTCGCNVGPLCRRHHRLKQLLMTKLRRAGAVLWTDPTGRTWTSASQHEPPQPQVRPLPDVLARTGDAQPADVFDECGQEDDGVEPVHGPDPLATSADLKALEPVDHRGWGLALDDPTRWDDDDPWPPGALKRRRQGSATTSRQASSRK